MPFVPAPDCAEAVINGTFHTKAIAHVLNFHIPGGYTQSDLDNLSFAVDAGVAADYLNLLNTSVHYDNVHVRGLNSIIDLESFNSTSTGYGTSSGTELPANATACITLRTGHTGRSARGRFYAWPTADGNLSTGQAFVGAYTTALKTFLDNLISATHLAGWDLVVLSRQSGGVPLTTAAFLEVTTVVVRNSEIDSQRGRLLQGH